MFTINFKHNKKIQMKLNFKLIAMSSLAISTIIAFTPKISYAESRESLCRRNAPYAADAAAGVNGLKVVRTGSSIATAFHYDAINPGGTFITGCEAEVVFASTGLINLRFNIHQVGNQYYVGSAPFDY